MFTALSLRRLTEKIDIKGEFSGGPAARIPSFQWLES